MTARREALSVVPIGVVHSPLLEKMAAPRQPDAVEAVSGTIELFPGDGIEHALFGLDGWSHLWVVFWFHRNEGWRPKVLPPRSRGGRVGVFATRSPHRPNPIGLSVVALERVDGLTLRVKNLDILDGTPVLDIKPYVAYADAYPEAQSGWLVRDPAPRYEVGWSAVAQEQTAWLSAHGGVDLVRPIEATLSLGPQPHPYRRIKPDGDAMCIAVKDWRARFRVEGARIEVLAVTSGYRPRELANSPDPSVALHRAFVARFSGAHGVESV